MNAQDAIARAADALWKAQSEGALIDGLPPEIRPLTRAQGYAIQSHIEGRSPRGVAGWKIAATSEGAQKHIRVSGPLAGRILGEWTYADGQELSLQGNAMRVAEIEFVFLAGDDIAPRAEPYTVAEALRHVCALHPGIEIPNSRLAAPTAAGEAQLIADNALAHQFVLGQEAPAHWRGLDLREHQVHATVSTADRSTRHQGSGRNVLTDPRIAFTWLVNELSALGLTLREGMFVTTGTCMPPLPVQPGSLVVGDFGMLGQVSCSFAE